MKTLKILGMVLFFVLMVNIALAGYNTLRPTILVNFSEPVNPDTVEVALTNSSGDEISLSDPVSQDNKEFLYTPLQDLVEGESYSVSASADDIGGNPGESFDDYSFVFELSGLKISLFNPRYYYTPKTTFDFIVNTSRQAECKYGEDTSLWAFDAMNNFDSSGSYIHTKINYSSNSYPRSIYVKCNDSASSNIFQERFIIKYDASIPTVSLSASPNPILELDNSGRLATVLKITTNDPTICRYSENNEENYTDMENWFPGGENNEHKTSHEIVVQLPGNNNNYTYYAACNNSAGLVSGYRSVMVNSNLDTGLSISVNSPERYVNGTEVEFDVTANKMVGVSCILSNVSDLGAANAYREPMNKEDYKHTKTITVEGEGSYTYYVICRKTGSAQVSRTITFSIDSSEPEMIYVNTTSPVENETDVTYRDDQLCAEWLAEDNESDITSYRYYIYLDNGSKDVLLEDGRTSDEDECESVDLENLEEYYWVVKAENGVGLWSDNITSDNIKVDTSLRPVGCDNDIKDGDEKGVDCGGSCSLGCANGVGCDDDGDCASDYCGSNDTCETPSCSDNVDNGAETDIDCGGSCTGCAVGKGCNDDDDCLSNNCDQSIGLCEDVVDSCQNSLLDIDETDVDCGGNCPRCGVGYICDTNDDCILVARCDSGECVMKPQDSDLDGIEDSVDNCPYSANADQNDIDMDGDGDKCDSDDDDDGLSDSWEQQYFGCETCADANSDPDADGLTNREEVQEGTNPNKFDTDGDGYSDGDEVLEGTNPLDPNSKPGNILPIILLILLILIVLGVVGWLVVTKVLPNMKKPAKKEQVSFEEPEEVKPMPKAAEPVKPSVVDKVKTFTGDVFARLRHISRGQLVRKRRREWLTNVRGVAKGAPTKGELAEKLSKIESGEEDVGERLERLKREVSAMQGTAQPVKPKEAKKVEKPAVKKETSPKKDNKEPTKKKPAKKKTTRKKSVNKKTTKKKSVKKKAAKKKGQIAGQMFIYILGFIIFALVLLYGYNAVKGFGEKAEQVTYIQFKSDFTRTIEKLSTDYGTEKREEFEVPSGYSDVCFIDSEKIGEIGFNMPDYPLIQDSVREGAEDNLFFIGKGAASPFNAGKMEVNRTGNGHICAPVLSNKVKVKLTGLGNRVRVEKEI